MRGGRIPSPRPGLDLLPVLALLGIVAAWYLGLGLLGGAPAGSGRGILLGASRDMGAALVALSSEATRRGYAPDPGTDPNGSGVIGLPWSGLTTTLGSLPAKRTAAQPDAAALLASLLLEAGVKSGDLVAIESSASFPGFTVAAFIASRALGARAVAVVSVGSSTFGANRPGFTLPDMLVFLRDRGLIEGEILGVSPGGGDDRGGDLDPLLLEAAFGRAAAGGLPALRFADLAADVAGKKALLESRGRPRVLLSVGGNWAAAGPGEALLGKTGLLTASELPASALAGTGLIQAFLMEGVPVIRILDVQDLCARYGLAFDPRPWPEAGRSGLYGPRHLPRALILAGPILGLALALGLGLLRRHRFPA